MNWKTERPTEEGLYWFYGLLYGKTALHEDDKPELSLVSAHEGRNSLTFVSGSSFLYDELGLWQECVTPDLPNPNYIYSIIEAE